MTVKELIDELKKFPMDKIVEIGSPTDDLGKVIRVVDFPFCVEIQSDFDIKDYL